MSERVHINLERMMPELEEYKNRGVFTISELQKIISTRKKHEFRLQRFDKKLLDIIRYIESEMTLEKIRDKRIKKKNLTQSYYDKRISEKIIKLYKDALYRFNDKKIIVMFTDYAVKKHLVSDMKDVYSAYCLKNASDTDLWIFCSINLFKVGDIESSRNMFLKCIRLNPKNIKIKIEFFRMEVLNIAKNIENLEEDEELEDGYLDVAYNIYLDIVELSENFDVKNELLQISMSVSELHKKICSNV